MLTQEVNNSSHILYKFSFMQQSNDHYQISLPNRA